MCSSLGNMHVCKGGQIFEREAKFSKGRPNFRKGGQISEEICPPPPNFLESLAPRGGANFLRHRSHTGAEYGN